MVEYVVVYDNVSDTRRSRMREGAVTARHDLGGCARPGILVKRHQHGSSSERVLNAAMEP